ncbi:MAG: TldD/PmbA family protein [SAR324 cluster bacterium]|nr:TldD/PmbA family protein [SAR324 cluster bacterium]
MIAEYKELAREIIEFSRKQGAEQVTVTLGSAVSFQVEIREQKIELLKDARSTGVHVIVAKDQKRSSVSSNDLRIEVLKPLIIDTLGSLPFMGEDPFYCLPDPELQGRAEGNLDFVDPDYESYEASEKIRQAMELEQKVLKLDARLNSEQSYYTDSISHSVYADSNGFADGNTKNIFNIGISAFVEDHDPAGINTARKQTDGWYSCNRRYHKLDSLDKIAEITRERVLRKIGAVKPKSTEVPVVFSPEMARSFIGNLAGALMGENVFRKHSFLADKLNESIASSEIYLMDDPLLPEKLGSRYFDSEGVKAKPLVLIEEGTLKNYMLSTYSAKKMGMTTTGHASGISNLLLRPGNVTEQELIESVKDGLYLTFMSGQGANLTTGDYSRGAQGIWIRNGKLAEPVNEFTIASTFMDMLRNIHMIADEIDDRSSILAPAFKVEKMSISGA